MLLPILSAAACGTSPTGPSGSESLPFVTETSTSRYYYEPGDSVEVARQEAFNTWAVERLGVTASQRVEYRKYRSRDAMGRYTGNSTTNGFAEPVLWRLHTILPFDNHEVVHIYTAVIGRPSDFFNEGIAVAFQADPANNNFAVRFNDQQVHDASRIYLRAGTLPQPVTRYATSTGFRSLSDTTLSYRYAGSFVLHMIERFGLPAVLRFFQVNNREETLDTIQSRMVSVFGVPLEDVEASWLAMLRQ
jgi:hypothetical protein